MSRLNIALAIAGDDLAWFEDSPDAGDPACICSYCGFAITEDQLCYRTFCKTDNTEARLCDNCLQLLDKQIERFRDKQGRLS